MAAIPTSRGANASAAILNTNLSTAVAFLVWVMWDYVTHRKPSMIGSVNGMIVGLVVITPAAGFVNGYGALAMGAIGSTLVYVAYNYVSRLRPFRNVDDTLGVVYTHGFAGLVGGLLVAVFADPKMLVYLGIGKGSGFSATGLISGNWILLKWQALTALFVICWSAIGTFVLLKIVGRFVSLRMSEEDMELGDVAVHGHEVYPSDVPSLALPPASPVGWRYLWGARRRRAEQEVIPSLQRRSPLSQGWRTGRENRGAPTAVGTPLTVAGSRPAPSFAGQTRMKPAVPSDTGSEREQTRHHELGEKVMPIEIIVSYDASNMDQDALALGQVLAGERNSLALAYVRHAKEEGDEREQLAAADAAELLDGGARLLGQPDAPRFIVFGASTPEGLSQLATSEQASLIVSAPNTAPPTGTWSPSPRLGVCSKVGDSRSPSRRLAFASATVIRRSDDRSNHSGRRPLCQDDRRVARDAPWRHGRYEPAGHARSLGHRIEDRNTPRCGLDECRRSVLDGNGSLPGARSAQRDRGGFLTARTDRFEPDGR